MASDESNSYLINAICDISGVSELSNLRKDLLEVKKRIILKTSNKSSIQRINAIQKEIDLLSAAILEKDAEIAACISEIDEKSKKRGELNNERTRLIGSSESKKNELAQRQAEAQSNYDECNTYVTEFCQNSLPYVVAEKAIRSTVNRAKKENSSIIDTYTIERLTSMINDGTAEDILETDHSEAKRCIERIIQSLQKTNRDNEILLDMTLPRIEQLNSKSVDCYSIESFLDKFRNRDFYSQEIEKYRKQVAKTEDLSLDEIDSEIAGVSAEIEIAKRTISIKSNEKIKLEQNIKDKTAERSREERSIVLEDVDKRSVNTIDEVNTALEKRITKTKNLFKDQLCRKINEIYDVLKNTKDMVKEVKITDDYRLQQIDFDNKPINIAYISEGEKGILMYSVMYGLHKLSKIKFPVVIDSPLGRLDSHHVTNLITKLYPAVADQVVLLSHDREVIKEQHDALKSHTAREFLIVKFGNPKVTEQYFE